MRVAHRRPAHYVRAILLAHRAALGRSQVVRQRILIPPSPGSNPGAPANQSVIEGERKHRLSALAFTVASMIAG
jgi:hypothetical protein